jgi:hypothetical protein
MRLLVASTLLFAALGSWAAEPLTITETAHPTSEMLNRASIETKSAQHKIFLRLGVSATHNTLTED